jgi:hypothetical protein
MIEVNSLQHAKKQNVFLKTMVIEKTEKGWEWACRAILTIHFWFCLSGYINYLQTKQQLNSPLIPKDVINQIAEPFVYPSLYLSAAFLISLWLYFFKKRIAVVIISGIAILSYHLYWWVR